MLRSLPLVALALTLSACFGGGKTQVKADSGPRYEAVKERSAKAHGDLAPSPSGTALAVEKGESKAEPARNEVQERKGKILGRDPDGCTWLEGSASVAVGPQDTRPQARAAAMEQARAAAIQDFLGVEVKSKFMDFQQEGLRSESRLTEGILQTTRSGRILKEDVLEEGYRDAPDCPGCLYRVRLKACVIPRPAEGDRDFAVELRVSSQRFFAGDEAHFSITASRDCWVYVYNIYGLGSVEETALVVPNEVVKEKRLKAGEAWVYPDEEARKAGVKMTAELPREGDQISAETIRVVATKAALPKSTITPAAGGWLGVLQRLNKSKVEWVEDAEAYTIYKK